MKKKAVITAILVLLMVGAVSAFTMDYDGFEDGDYTSNPQWTEPSSNGNANVQTGTVKNGNDALEISTSGSGEHTLEHDRGSSDSIDDGDVYQAWINTEVTDDYSYYGLSNTAGDEQGDDYAIIFVDSNGGININSEADSNTDIASISSNTWYKVELEFDVSNNEVTGRVYDSGNSLLGSETIDWASSSTSNLQYVFLKKLDFGSAGSTFFDDVSYSDQPANRAPSIDSTDHAPKPTRSDDQNIDYTVNASDSDGDNLDAWISVSYWNNGTEFISDRGMSEPSTNDFKVSDLHNISVVNDGYNATFKVSDGSTNTTGSENFYISDDSPGLVINKPSNSTKFDYDVDWKISNNDDGDDIPGEVSSCDVWDDGSLLDSFNLSEGSSQADTLRSDKGTHEFNATCTELNGSQLTTNKQKYYSVKRFEIQSNSTASPVYETENTTYSVSVKIGDMVNDLSSQLFWNSSSKSNRTYSNAGTVSTITQKHFFHPPLITNNASSYTWQFNYTSNYTDFSNNSYTTETRKTGQGSQTVYQAFTDPFTLPSKDRGIEKEDFETDLNFSKELNSVNPNVTRFLKYNGTVKTGNNSVFEIPLVPGNSATENLTVKGDLQLSFKGKKLNRSASTQEVAGYKKILTDCSTPVNGVTGVQSKVFELRNEENQSQTLKGDIDFNINVDHHGEHTRNYAFNNSDNKTADVCIYPAWTEYTGNGPIDYKSSSSQNVNSKDYPQRDIQLLNESLTNTSEKRKLYLLEAGLSVQVIEKVVDQSNNPIEDVRVKNLRYFTGSDSFLTVSSLITNSDGEASTQLKPDISYKHILTKDERVIKETDKEQLICDTNPCTKTFQIGEEFSQYFQYEEGFSYKLTKLKNSNSTVNGLQASVNHRSQTIQNATFTVEKPGVVNRETVCSITTQSTGQSMVCQFNQTVEDQEFFYKLTSYKEDEKYLLTQGSIGVSKGFLQNNPWSAAMLFLVVTSFGLISPRMSIAFSTAGFIVTWWIGLITLSIASVASIVMIAAAVTLTGGGR